MYQRFFTIALLLLVSLGWGCSSLRKGPLTWQLMLEVDAGAPDREAATQQTARIIEQRLDAFGVNNFKVEVQSPASGGRIKVSLADVPDRERIKGLITAGGLLELMAVVGPASPSPVQIHKTKQEAVASLGGTVPANRRVLPYPERDSPTETQSPGASEQPEQWVLVEFPAIVDGTQLRTASAIPSRTDVDDYQISFSLKPEGAEKFGAWTAAHINNYLGVVLNGEVKSIAYIKSRITDQGEITGRLTRHSAEDLALVLRSGALPAAVKIIEEASNK